MVLRKATNPKVECMTPIATMLFPIQAFILFSPRKSVKEFLIFRLTSKVTDAGPIDYGNFRGAFPGIRSAALLTLPLWVCEWIHGTIIVP